MMADENEENDKQFDEVGDRKSNDLDEDFLTLGDVDDESDEDEAKGETEVIRIAQGKYKFPESLKETFQQFKQELQWKKLQ